MLWGTSMRTIVCCFLFLVLSGLVYSQEVNGLVRERAFSAYEVKQPAKRKLLDLEGASLGTKLNPLTYLATGLMYVYQNVFSEQISASCSYEVSCSEMTKKAIEKYGLIKGCLIGIHQLSSCIPGVRHQHPDYMTSPDNKIRNGHAL